MQHLLHHNSHGLFFSIAHCMDVKPHTRNTATENLEPAQWPISVLKLTLKLSFILVYLQHAIAGPQHLLHTKETASLTASQSALQSTTAS